MYFESNGLWHKILFAALFGASFFLSPAAALFLGILFALTLGNPYAQLSKSVSKKLLQYCVVGLGFGMNFHASLAAGRDGMLLNLSGAHAPFFTRNLVILTDNSGHTGVGEVPGGEKIRKTLEDARDLVVGQTIGACNNILASMRQTFADRAGDEVDAFETISEKTALAERFGLRIPYLTMNKPDYLALVDHLAAQVGLDIPADRLHAQAMTWEIRHAGRTPRVARQFVASLS